MRLFVVWLVLKLLFYSFGKPEIRKPDKLVVGYTSLLFSFNPGIVDIE
jgi:hypothetical protein